MSILGPEETSECQFGHASFSSVIKSKIQNQWNQTHMESGLEVVNMSFEFLNFETQNHFKITTFLYVQINDFELKMTINERKFCLKSDFFFTPNV